MGRPCNIRTKLLTKAMVAQVLVEQATIGHRTEEAFNHYVGVDQLPLVEEFRRKSTRRRAA